MAPKSAITPVNGKRKRIRKRQRRTTVTQAADDDSDSSSSSSSSDSESSSSSSSSSSDSDSSSSSSSDSENETKVSTSKSDEKRHRKRVRKPKQNTGAEVSQATTEEHKIANAIEKFAKLTDPQEDKRLSEATISALTYAKQYAVDKQQWKFNKARQEHLIRHMLSRAPQEENTNETIEKPERETNEEAAAAADQTHQPSWWPDEWNECVAFYLSTVQGGAKDRLLKRLREAKEQVTPAPIQPLVQEFQPAQSTQEAVMPSASTKSVNFADMATVVDAQPSVEEQAEKEADRQRIIFEKKRATALLKFMKQ